MLHAGSALQDSLHRTDWHISVGSAFVFRSNFVNLQWEGQPSRRTIQTSAEKNHWIQTKNSFSLSLSTIFAAPPPLRFPSFFVIFLFLFFCNCDSRSGFEVVLRLLVPGGSGDWSLCTGRRRSRSSDHTAGSKERSRQEDGATGGGTALAPGTSSPYLAHHGAAEQSASPRECNCEPGSEHGAYRGEWGNLWVASLLFFCLVWFSFSIRRHLQGNLTLNLGNLRGVHSQMVLIKYSYDYAAQVKQTFITWGGCPVSEWRLTYARDVPRGLWWASRGVEDEAGSEISAPHQTHLPVVGDLNASCRHSSVITGSSLSSRPTLDKAEGSELKP